MTGENREQGDVPQLSISSLQSNEELALFDLQHGSDDLAGIFNREVESAHHCLTRNEHVFPQSYGQGMPFHDDVSLFHKPGQDCLDKPVSDCSVSIRNEKGTDFEHALGDLVASANIHADYQFPSIRNVKETKIEHVFVDSVASANIQANYLDSSRTGRNIMVSGADVVRGLQTCRTGGEYNDGLPLLAHNPTSKELDPNRLWNDTAIGETNDNNAPRPWLTGNQFIQACNASGHNSTIGELAMSNFTITGAAQPNHPGVLDGNFLSLGCGTFEETDSICDIHFPDREQITGGVLLPLFNTSPDARGSLNCSPTITNGISSFPNFAGDNRNLTNDDPFRAHSLGQNASSFPDQVGRDIKLPNPLVMQNVEVSFNPMLNAGKFSHQAPATNRDRSSANNAGLPNAALPRETRMLSQSSKVGFTHPASDRPQNQPTTTVRNFSPGPVMARPFIGVPGRMGSHGHSGPVTVPYNGVPRSMISHGQSGPVVVPPHEVSRSMPWQSQTGIPGQSQASVSVNPSKSTHAHASASEQQIRQVNVPQSSNIHSGPSLKRGASKLSPNAPATQRRKTRPVIPSVPSMPTLRHIAPHMPPAPSMPTLRQIAPHVPPGPYRPTLRQIAPHVPPGPSMLTLRQIAPHVPPGPSMPTLRHIAPHVPPGPSMPTLRQIAPHVPPASIDSLKPHLSRLLQNPALLSSLLGTQSSHHIKWHEEDKQSPSGFQCSICKRDLSYTPEGPVYQPDKLLPTSVLPCGHYFHSSCLLQITPADQAGNPPCIPCALDG